MSEIKQMLNMNYDECCNYLKQKYGIITKSYFTDETCKSATNSIKRGKEGLYIHHIDEDKAILLSTPAYAIKNPFSYQMGERLVYCTLLEHLVLHIKIMEYPHPNKNPDEMVGFGGIFNFQMPELNDIYSGIQYKPEWKKKVVSQIIDLEDDYFYCIEYLIKKFKSFPLGIYTRSFNEQFQIWDSKNNKKIYEKIEQIFNKYNN